MFSYHDYSKYRDGLWTTRPDHVVTLLRTASVDVVGPVIRTGWLADRTAGPVVFVGPVRLIIHVRLVDTFLHNSLVRLVSPVRLVDTFLHNV